MRVRPLDANGDFMPIYSAEQMVSGGEAVGQVIKLRLKFLHGEWWEDPDIGFRIPDFLAETARSGDIDMLGKYISAYVSESEGVRSIEDMNISYENHTMTFACSVLTDDGESEVVEVIIDGIL